MRCDIDRAENVEKRELDEDEFWRGRRLHQLKDQLTEEIAREYAEKGFLDIANFNPRDWTWWLRVGLAL